jgi:hypothetical protein
MVHEKLSDNEKALEYFQKANNFPELPNPNISEKLAEFQAKFGENASDSTRPSVT